jgi:hypothetical protein
MRVTRVHCAYFVNKPYTSGPCSSVSIVTGYGLDGPGIESRRGRDFLHLSSLLYNGYWGFPGGRKQPGVMLTPHHFLVLRSENRVEIIPLLSLRAFMACKKDETYLPYTNCIVYYSYSTFLHVTCL